MDQNSTVIANLFIETLLNEKSKESGDVTVLTFNVEGVKMQTN